jgi:hypothetical protein
MDRCRMSGCVATVAGTSIRTGSSIANSKLGGVLDLSERFLEQTLVATCALQHKKRVVKHRDRFFESDSVLLHIQFDLRIVPDEVSITMLIVPIHAAAILNRCIYKVNTA